jgi:hypothetical protein
MAALAAGLEVGLVALTRRTPSGGGRLLMLRSGSWPQFELPAGRAQNRAHGGPKKKGLADAKPLISFNNLLVETRRIELLTFALRSFRA